MQREIDKQLIEAAKDSNLAQLRRIVEEYSGDVNAQNNHGQSAVIFSAKNNRLEILQYLVSHGADVHHQDNLGQSALDWAMHNGNQEMINFIEHLPKYNY
jgi:ankyrin repeat protein